MKSRPTLLVVFALLALAAELAWKFWPKENSAPSANPSATNVASPKTAAAPDPKPTPVAAVEAPKIAPAIPKDAPATASGDNAPKAQAALLQARLAAEQARAAMQDGNLGTSSTVTQPSNNITDFGEVYFTSGVPQQLTMNDGSPVTVTATLTPSGDLQLKLDLERHDPDGKVIGRSQMMMTTKSTGQSMTLRALGGAPGGTAQIKITPHVN